jgi:hypothetical protein
VLVLESWVAFEDENENEDEEEGLWDSVRPASSAGEGRIGLSTI